MNTYIILAAGKGTSLQPLTLKYTKTSYKLDENTTVLQRMVRTIRKADRDSEIVVVVGYRAADLKSELDGLNVKFVTNPFYEVTSSITSLWFARQYLERENVTIINGDTVFSEELIEEYIAVPTQRPFVLIDGTCTRAGTYNAMVRDDKVLVMSRELEHPDARYSGVAKLDPVTSRLLKQEVDDMVNSGMYDQYMENALVQMVMFRDLELGAVDIAGKAWVEVDVLEDFLRAQEIHKAQL